ncbi:MAG: SMP-30/gluconolactonase/LRE family protein [Polaromonas sp.]|uniref:SMP-30/gluconolactonase/LRE family protein n=1 Tax=Polaromonas sp. TaxID=1869339 RepID=UPI0025D16479|nr:SMP-30/gluconolactonase/LRE family protein [Polaromonas sp.]MBI2726524.1 SMP-30/gluconolactonase/LRE family protein [Polaromonas sp.]
MSSLTVHGTPPLLASGLAWPESPRWHNNSLWFSDVHNFRLMKLEPGQLPQKVADVPGRPAGLGVMPDGRLLLATALDKRLWWVQEDGNLVMASDLSSHAQGLLNDMIVDEDGRVWVGDTGFDLLKGEPEKSGSLLTWSPGEEARIAAPDVRFPNGIAVCRNSRKLYLAETFGQCITSFDISVGGILTNRRVHASLSGRPDGMCLDSSGALWVALLWDQEFQRISLDGQVLERIKLPHERAISCVLGGVDRKSLFLGVCEIDEQDKKNITRNGSIRFMTAETAGAGIP